MINSKMLILLAVLVGFGPNLATAQVSGLCDCQYVECAPDAVAPMKALCLWLSTKRTIQVISVNVAKPDLIAPLCKEMEYTVDFARLPDLNLDYKDGLADRRGMVVCEELRFF